MLTKRYELFSDFVATFMTYAMRLREVFMSLIVLIIVGGVAISFVEDNITLGDSIYFAFITALSVGYGDITPSTTIGKVVSVGIGMLGIFFVGITAAVANRALADTTRRTDNSGA